MEAVYKNLQRYTRTHCLDDDVNHTTLDALVDLNAIAEHQNAEETTKVIMPDREHQAAVANLCKQLLKVFVVAAIKGNNSQKFISVCESGKLSEEVLMVIYHIMTQVEADKAKCARLSKEIEEQKKKITELSKENEDQKKKNADLNTRMEHLQTSREVLLDNLRTKDGKLDEFAKSQNNKPDDYILHLQGRLDEAERLIENQEKQLEDDRLFKRQHEKDLRNLRPVGDFGLLENKVKVLEAANEELSRKANVMAHYKAKVESQTREAQENTVLLERIDILQSNQQEFDRVHEENDKLQATVRELQQRNHSYEQDTLQFEAQLRLNKAELVGRDAEIERLLARKEADEVFITSLREKERTDSPKLVSSPSPTAKVSHLTLEEELAQSDDPAPNYPLEIARLQAEIQLFKSQLGGTTAANLRIELDELDMVRKRLESKYRDLQEAHILGQAQLSAVLGHVEAEKLVDPEFGLTKMLIVDFYRDETISITRKLYMETLAELNQVKTKLVEVQTELSSRDREILEVKADLSAVNKDDLDALEDLKATNEIVTSSLQNDLLLLQSKFKTLMTDHDQQKSHLVDALLAKDALSREVTALKEGGNATAAPQKTAEVSNRPKSSWRAPWKSRPVAQDDEDPELARELAALAKAAGGSHDPPTNPPPLGLLPCLPPHATTRDSRFSRDGRY